MEVATCNGDLLKAEARRLEEKLRLRYGSLSREELIALAPYDAYAAYYKAFGYTYHVQAQLESVVRGKPIPDVLPPVTAMFMAELNSGILTAGHDLDAVRLPIECRRAAGSEEYTALNGKQTRCVEGDWLIRDQEGVLSSILRGPDRRTAITAQSRRILYTAYAPEGVSEAALAGHLRDIEAFVRLVSDASAPGAQKIVPVCVGGSGLLDAGEL
jgi:DNA/RNA-binding domain of Phe-tRNA-synthetase-like protein